MFNVILTLKDGKQYYIGCDCSIVVSYNNNNSFKYKFDDYEDARNVRDDFAFCKFVLNYNEEKINKLEKIEVVQM